MVLELKIVDSILQVFLDPPSSVLFGDMILPVISLYLLRSNNSITQTSSIKCNNQTGSTLVLQTTLLPLLQVLHSLEVLVF